MPRSMGYRANKENAEVVKELREKLGECTVDSWQRAGYIMQQIAQLTSKGVGPSYGRVEPRACKYCKYYGHTKQHCKKRKMDEDAEVERLLKREREELKVEQKVVRKLPWWQMETQGDMLDYIRVPYKDDGYVGEVPLDVGETGGIGKWIRMQDGTVKQAEECGRRILPVTARDVRS